VWEKSQDFIQTLPSSKVNNVSDYEYIDYQDQVAWGITDQTEENLKKVSTEQYIAK
jgi:hypothetical protein